MTTDDKFVKLGCLIIHGKDSQMITLNKKNLINVILLLSLPILIGGSLFIAMNGYHSGLRLLFLSLFGIYPTLKFIHYRTLKNKKFSLLFFIIAVIWWLIFCVHSAILSASWLIFGGNIDSFFIVQAIANTTPAETQEFLSFHWVNFGFITLNLIAIIGGYFLSLIKFFDVTSFKAFQTTKPYKVLFSLFIVICLASYIIKPSRNHSPFVFWKKYYDKIELFKAENAQHKTYQQNWINFAKNDIIENNHQKQTHILVISESLTSKNMNVCGYPRKTTPFITQHQNELIILCHAYSRYSTTINSIKAMLTDIKSNPESIPTQSILGYAKASGFKTFWISNQDDSYLSSLFGDFTDEKIYHNKLGGRSSFSLDEQILPYIDTALKDTADKKLIIVHLIGSHPNYSARYPEKFNIFPTDKQGFDQINAEMDKHHIGMITKQHRDNYDNSVIYQDWIFNEIFNKIKADNSHKRSMTFLSDHGNEVGHEKDYAGHSNTTEAGFQVPIILWQNNPTVTGIELQKKVDASLLDNYLLTIMGIKTKSAQPTIWTDNNYQFDMEHFPYWQNNK